MDEKNALAGRFFLINNILCKSATNEGTFCPQQVFGKVPLEFPPSTSDEMPLNREQSSLSPVPPHTPPSSSLLHAPSLQSSMVSNAGTREESVTEMSSSQDTDPHVHFSTSPTTVPEVLVDPNCFVAHIFGVASGGVLLDSYNRTTVDVTDDAIISSSVFQTVDPKTLFLSSEPPVISSSDMDRRKVRSFERRQCAKKEQKHSSSRGPTLGSQSNACNVELLSPGDGIFPHEQVAGGAQVDGSIAEQQALHLEEEQKAVVNGEEDVFGLQGVLPPPLLECCRLSTVPCRNLVVYGEGNEYADITPEAHYSLISSIEPLQYRGTPLNPLVFPRSFKRYDNATRGRISTTKWIWNSLSIVGRAPVVSAWTHSNRNEKTQAKEQHESDERPSADDASALFTAASEEGSRMSHTENETFSVENEEVSVTSTVSEWKKWIEQLEVCRWLLKRGNTLSTSFSFWKAKPHLYYPQANGRQVLMRLPRFRLDESGGEAGGFPNTSSAEKTLQYFHVHNGRTLKIGEKNLSLYMVKTSKNYSVYHLSQHFRLFRKSLKRNVKYESLVPSASLFSQGGNVPETVPTHLQMGRNPNYYWTLFRDFYRYLGVEVSTVNPESQLRLRMEKGGVSEDEPLRDPYLWAYRLSPQPFSYTVAFEKYMAHRKVRKWVKKVSVCESSAGAQEHTPLGEMRFIPVTDLPPFPEKEEWRYRQVVPASWNYLLRHEPVPLFERLHRFAAYIFNKKRETLGIE